MKNTLIFDTMIDGHHLEYIHHLYMGIDQSIDFFYFIIPSEFEELKVKFSWPNKKNVEFIYIGAKELNKISRRNHLIKSLLLSLLLRKYVLKYKINDVLLISIIDYYPLLMLLIPFKTKISGIIYKIYLYEWKGYALREKLYEAFRQLMMVKGRQTKCLFVLNDTSSPIYLNKLWHTNKFCYLVDPYIPIKYPDLNKFKIEIPNNKIIFLHMGAMEERKGTLEILDAIKILSNTDKYCFIFAGKISKSIASDFYKKYEELRNKSSIILIDDFCDYELLANLSFHCDCFLLPYKRVSLSSGILYYAAQFNKDVIATNKGLLGKLIRKNCLGIGLANSDPQSIAYAIQNYIASSKVIRNSYLSDNTVDNFNKIIFTKLQCQKLV